MKTQYLTIKYLNVPKNNQDFFFDNKQSLSTQAWYLIDQNGFYCPPYSNKND